MLSILMFQFLWFRSTGAQFIRTFSSNKCFHYVLGVDDLLPWCVWPCLFWERFEELLPVNKSFASRLATTFKEVIKFITYERVSGFQDFFHLFWNLQSTKKVNFNTREKNIKSSRHCFIFLLYQNLTKTISITVLNFSSPNNIYWHCYTRHLLAIVKSNVGLETTCGISCWMRSKAGYAISTAFDNPNWCLCS